MLRNKLTTFKISQYPSLFYILSNLTQLASRLGSTRYGNEPKRQAREPLRAEPSRSELEPAREPRAYFLALRGQFAQSQSRRQKVHRTVNSTCPVHHRNVRWPHMSELQQSNPNGWVMWLAHRTVSGTPIDSSLSQWPLWWLGL
jgi:hypothetical protein